MTSSSCEPRLGNLRNWLRSVASIPSPVRTDVVFPSYGISLVLSKDAREHGDSHLHFLRFLRSSVFQRFWVFRSRATCPGIAVDHAAITRDLSRRSRGSRRFPSRDLRKSVQSV